MELLDQILKESKNLVITSHLSPDPDAICSILAISNYLINLYPNINQKCLVTGDRIDSLKDLPLIERINYVSELNDHLTNVDTLFFVDASDLKRFSVNYQNLDISKFKTICIDHHNNVTPEYDFSSIDYAEPSCTQYIYKLLYKDSNLLNKELAEIFLTGICSDTVMLRYTKQLYKETLDLTNYLCEVAGTDMFSIETKNLSLTKGHLELLGILIANIKYVDDCKYKFAYSFLDKDVYNRYSLSIIEEVKDWFLQSFAGRFRDYGFMFIAKPYSKEIINLSFRANKNSINVRLLAEQFGGGGHNHRSGAKQQVPQNVSIEDFTLEIANKIKNFNLDDFKL